MFTLGTASQMAGRGRGGERGWCSVGLGTVSLLESDPSHDWTGRAAENLQACRSAVPSPVMPGGHGRKRIDSGSLGTGTILLNSNSAHASPIPLIL